MSDADNRDDEEDLMSDFKDLFSEDEEAAQSPQPAGADDTKGTDEALDELDAFLDDFEKGLSPEQENQGEELAPPEEPQAATESATGDTGNRNELELDREELDLAMSQAGDGEVFDDHWGEDDAEVENVNLAVEPQATDSEAEQEGKVSTAQPEADPLAEVAALAASAPVAATASNAGRSAQPGGTMLRSVIAVMLVALGLSATAAWLAFSTSSKVDQLAQSVQALQKKNSPVKGSASALSAMHTELRTLGARVNELAVVIEGPMSHLQQSNEGVLSDIERRLSQLEKGVSGRPNASQQKPVPAAPPSAPVKRDSTKGGWAINLISLSSEKDADAELSHLRSLGVRVEKQRVVSDGKTWYRLRVPGFTSYEGAKAYIDTVQKKAGVKNAWVAKE